MNREKIVCLEMGTIAKKALQSQGQEPGNDAFIDFLRYCSERLNRGDSVQAIWRDFQEKAQ